MSGMALHMGASFHVFIRRGMLPALRLGRSSTVMVLVALQAGCQPHRHRAGHHGVGTDQHQRPAEARNLFRPIAAEHAHPAPMTT